MIFTPKHIAEKMFRLGKTETKMLLAIVELGRVSVKHESSRRQQAANKLKRLGFVNIEGDAFVDHVTLVQPLCDMDPNRKIRE